MQNIETDIPERRNARAHVSGRGRQDLAARLLQFAARIVRVSAALPKNEEGLHIRRQILRSGTSAGANYQEARGAESRADFLHKMQIVLKELRETHFWLSLIEAAEFLPKSRLAEILAESDELIAIVVKSLITARRRGTQSAERRVQNAEQRNGHSGR